MPSEPNDYMTFGNNQKVENFHGEFKLHHINNDSQSDKLNINKDLINLSIKDVKKSAKKDVESVVNSNKNSNAKPPSKLGESLEDYLKKKEDYFIKDLKKHEETVINPNIQYLSISDVKRRGKLPFILKGGTK